MSSVANKEEPLRRALGLVRQTFHKWREDDILRWGAAIAYYSVVSLAPLVAIGVTALGQVVRNDRAERWILEQVRVLAGPPVAEVASSVAREASTLHFASPGAIVTGGLLVFSAMAVFVNLQHALNRIWSVQARSGVIRDLVRTRVAAFATVGALGVFMIAAVISGAVLGFLKPALAPVEPYFPLFQAADFVSSLLLLWLVISVVFRVVPDVEISWRDVGFGALLTALLLVIGKAILSWVLSSSVVASLYGTAGAIFALLIWVYYSANVFFLGAEFTHVWARTRGRAIRPQSHAVGIEVVGKDR